MDKKQIFTGDEIEKDIITALKNPSGSPEASYEKSKVPQQIVGLVGGVALVVLMLIRPMVVLWTLLALLAFAIGFLIFAFVQHTIRIKKVSVSDYHISTETVHSIDEEHYYIKGGKYRRGINVNNYVIRFENGKEWRIPKDNYLWSVERPMSDFAIYQCTHRGDTMIAVTKIDTDKIVMAYHTDFFEYKE